MVLDGVLAIGIDVLALLPHGIQIFTTGDPTQLTDFTEGNDIAVSINRVAAGLAFDGVEREIRTQIEDEGASLDLFTFAVEEGRFFIGGRASQTGGHVDFSMGAVPQLTRPGFSREHDELWFDMRDIHVDVSLSWWAAALATIGSIVTLGFGAVVVKGFMDMQRGHVTSSFARKDAQRQAARVQEFTLPGTSGPVIRLTLERFECHEKEVFIGSTLKPQFPAPRLDGDRVLTADDAMTHSARYRVRLPFDVLDIDAQLNVRWTVRRVDTNEILLTVEDRAHFLQTIRSSAGRTSSSRRRCG